MYSDNKRSDVFLHINLIYGLKFLNYEIHKVAVTIRDPAFNDVGTLFLKMLKL